jgi:hypothetical protein
MIVDGAAETIATMMTIPPDASAYGFGSSIYDTSNFTIQAISFGKAPIQYYLNAHKLDGISKYGREASGQIWVSGIGASGTSSYVPLPFLPTSPSPYDNYLVDLTDSEFLSYISTNIADVTVSTLGYTNIDGLLLSWGSFNLFPLYQAPENLNPVSSIESSDTHFITLGINGQVSCWGGINAYGELNVPTTLGDCISVAARRGISYAIKNNNTLVGWGNSAAGALSFPGGDFTTNCSSVCAGRNFITILKTDGTASSFGNVISGPSIYAATHPPQAIQGNIKKVKSHWGADHTLALLNNNSVSGWITAANSPSIYNKGQVTFPALPNTAVDIAAGSFHSLICFSDGTVSAFGDNTYGQCTVPSAVQGRAVGVAAGISQSFAILSDGQVSGWGNDFVTFISTLQVPNDSNKKVKDISVGYDGRYAHAVYTSTLEYATLGTSSVTISSVDGGFYNSENYKQNVNLLPFPNNVINKMVINDEVVDIIPSAIGTLLDGAYAPSGGVTVVVASGVAPYTVVASASVSGTLNTQGNIDFRGYIKNITPATNPANGLVVSSVNVSSNGEITYSLTLGTADCTVANLYGGITSMGLWTYDLQKNLAKGDKPPYVFKRLPEESGTYKAPLDYKLFAKKTFNDNILKIKDYTTFAAIDRRSSLQLRWRLYFL